MAFGVLLQRLQVVEAHGLLVEDADEELQGVVVLEPGHLVGGYTEGEGVGLGEHVLAGEFLEYLLDDGLGDAAVRRAAEELFPVGLEQVFVVLSAEGASEVVGLPGAEAGDVDGELVDLVLEQDDAQGASQGPLLQGVVEVPGDPVGVAADELGDAVVGPDAGAHRGDLVGHLDQVAGPDAGDGLHLGRRLDLEYADGVGPVQGAVDVPVLEVDAREVDVPAGALFDELQGLLHLGEGSQGEEVDLDEAGVVDAVLVPVADVAAVDGAGLRGDDVDQRRGADDHAAGVLGQVFGEATKLRRQLYQVTPAGGVHLVAEVGQEQHLGPDAVGVAGVDPFGQLVDVLDREAQRLAQVPDAALHLVGADHAGQDGAVPAPPLVHPLDKLLTDVAGEVQVDVGHRAHVVADEALQGQVVLQGVDVGEADQVAHQHGHRRAPAPARRPLLQGDLPVAEPQVDHHVAGDLDYVVVDQEEAGQVVPADEAELLVQPLADAGRHGAVPPYHGPAAELLQVGLGGVAVGHRVVGEAVAQVPGEVEALP